MNTEKKNQHYIPKFYLRNFSWENNLKQLGVYHPESEFFYPRSRLKTQGSKNFYYGYDGEIEDWLSQIESRLARIIRNITASKELPIKGRIEHQWLLAFVGLTHLRNPVIIQGIIDAREQVRRRFQELSPDSEVDDFIPKATHEEAVEMSLSNVMHIVENIIDLDYKLMINETSIPFITSDFPIVKYNRFLEDRNWKHGKSGYGSKGLQIIIPLNPRISIIFYDQKIYKVGDKKKQFLQIKNDADIDQLNTLQILNCLKTVFFNEGISEHYIRSLHNKSKQYTKPNQSISKIGNLAKNENSNKETTERLIIVGKTDLETKLDIQGIKKLSTSNLIKLDNSIAQMRDHTAQLRKNER